MRNTTAYIWTFLGKLAPQVIYMLTTMVLARLLSPNDFGEIGVLTVFLVIATTLNDAGLGGSLIHAETVTKTDSMSIFCFNFTMSGIMYMILFSCSSQIENYFHTPGLSVVIKLIGLVFVINSLGLVPRALLYRSLNFKTVMVSAIISVIGASGMSILLALHGYGVFSLVGYQIAQAFINSVILLLYSPPFLCFNIKFDSLRRLLPFGIYTTIVSIIDAVYENIITFVFGKVYNMTQAGYLSQAKKIEDASSTSISQSINTAAFPILSRFKNNIEEFKKECKDLLGIVIDLIIPVMGIISIYSKEIIIMLFGVDWIQASDYLSLLMIAGVFMILEVLVRNFIKSLGAVKQLLNITIYKRICGILTIIGALLIAKDFMLYGYIIGAIVGLLFNLYLYSSILNIGFGKTIMSTIIKMMKPTVVIVVIYCIHTVNNNLWINMVCSGLCMIIYYGLFLYKSGFGLCTIKKHLSD